VKRIGILLGFLFLASPSWAQVSFSVNIGSPGFYLSVGNFFGYPEREVIVIHERGIRDDDLAVVFFISRYARIAPEAVIKLRVVDHWSWVRICDYYRIPPTAFYITVQEYGPPYGHAYGYYRRHPHQSDWAKIRLTDADIVNQVNLIFISKYYDYPPERVIRMRDLGTSFGNIERKVYREREYQARGIPPQESHRPGPSPQVRSPQGRPAGPPPQTRMDVPPQGVRPPSARFQDVYPAASHPSQAPKVKGGTSGEKKGQGPGQGKKDKRDRD
jgi:hypothetical protein